MLSAITGFLAGACALLAGASGVLALVALVVAGRPPRLATGCVVAIAACGLVWATWAVILGYVSSALAGP